MEHPVRRISSRRWPVSVVVAALTVVACVLTLTFIASPSLASTPRSTGGGHQALPEAVQKGVVTKAIAACERRGTVICNRRAYDKLLPHLPLAKPDPKRIRRGASAGLSEAQVIASQGFTGDAVGASEMTYGQAQASYPLLAAESSAIVDPTREVWVMTAYFSSPTYIDGSGMQPATAPQGNMQVTSESVVVDAATGQTTDQCFNCALIAASSDRRGRASSRH